jgi:hypothetical protein
MDQQPLKPTRVWYFVGAGLLLAVSVFFVWGIVGFISAIGSAMGQQVMVPGSGEVTVPAGGTYNIVHEYQTVIDGQMYNNPPMLPGLKITMKDAATGKDVPLRTVPADINIALGSRHGLVLMDFNSPAGGKYVLTGQYPPGEEGPKAVLSVGGEMGSKIMPFVMSIGLFVFGLMGSIAIFVVVAILRSRNRRRMPAPPPLA